MMSAGIAALSGFFGLTSVFAVVAAAFAGWMAWRIVEKAGLPGWAGLGAVLLTLTGIGSIVPLVLLWVFAFMRWPRDEAMGVLPPPRQALPDGRRAWRLAGTTSGGSAVSLAIDGSADSYVLTGAPARQPTDLSIPDPSVSQPHARLLVSGDRLGLEDLGSRGGTFIDGARLLPTHGPRDISNSRSIRLGSVDLALMRA
ncbi:MAG: FHA domain-containing protein [Reyranellales bacterium]